MVRCFEDGGAMHLVVYSKNRSSNKNHLKNEDVLCNPQNPVNPDSEPRVRVKFQL